ncbi:flavodoxin domain-containing protein [Candidatus Bipolaricaulota bacterium]
MAGIIVYASNYGSTRQYAEWIHEETGFQMYQSKDRAIPWAESAVVVIGSPIMAGKPILAKWTQKMWSRMKDATVVFYTTSQTPPTEQVLQEGFRSTFPEKMVSAMKYFPLHGKMTYANLGGLHKMMMRIGVLIEKDPAIKKQMMVPVDGVNRGNVEEIVRYIRGIQESPPSN